MINDKIRVRIMFQLWFQLKGTHGSCGEALLPTVARSTFVPRAWSNAGSRSPVNRR